MLNRKMLLIVLVLLVSACSKLTMENYAKLKAGLAYDEVKALLGDPVQCSEVLGIRACQWGDDNKNINVNFVGGKAVLFSAANLK